MSGIPIQPFQLMSSLKQSYLKAPWYKKSFFPKTLGAALIAYNENQPKTANPVIDALYNTSRFFQRRFLLSLKVIQAFHTHQISPWVVDTLVKVATLPAGTTLVDLGWHGFGKKIGTELFKTPQYLPPGVTSVTFGHNDITNKTYAEIAMVLGNLPQSVTSVDLSRNSFHQRTGAELAAIFASLTPSVTSVDLSHNCFGLKTADELVMAFQGLPKSVTSLNLESMNMHNEKTGAELAKVFQSLPHNLTSIELGLNRLGSKNTGAELASIFRSLPRSLISIGLGGNALHNKTGAELAIAFAGLPQSVASVNLSNNSLHLKTGAELAIALRGIPQSVTSLDLSNNGLDKLSLEDLTALENALPHIKTLCLGSVEINEMTLEKRRALMKVFPGLENKEENITYKDVQNCKTSIISRYSLLRDLSVVPSLKMTCAFFFVSEAIKKPDISCGALEQLPEAVTRYLKS